MQLFQLRFIYTSGGFGHQALSLLGLGKGDYVPNIIGTEQQHNQTIQSPGDAAVRRRAILQRLEEKAKAFLGFFRGDAQQGKYLRLDIGLMNTNAANLYNDITMTRLVYFLVFRRILKKL